MSTREVPGAALVAPSRARNEATMSNIQALTDATRAAHDAGTVYRALATASAWLGEPYDTRADAALDTLRAANRALRAARAHVGA